MSKPYWLWALVPVFALGGAIVRLQKIKDEGVAASRPSDPGVHEAKTGTRDGIYTLAQDSFGPVKAAVLIVNGKRATWYRHVVADSSDRHSANLNYGDPCDTYINWVGEVPAARYFTGPYLEAQLDDAGRLELKITSVAEGMYGGGNRGPAANVEQFVLKKTNLTSPPSTLAELIDAQGEPQTVQP